MNSATWSFLNAPTGVPVRERRAVLVDPPAHPLGVERHPETETPSPELTREAVGVRARRGDPQRRVGIL
jgi:hypothetical protein